MISRLVVWGDEAMRKDWGRVVVLCGWLWSAMAGCDRLWLAVVGYGWLWLAAVMGVSVGGCGMGAGVVGVVGVVEVVGDMVGVAGDGGWW